jgi:hypothetical protein
VVVIAALGACRHEATCGDDAVELGRAGGFGEDSFPLRFTTDPRTGLRVARQVAAVVPGDTVGLALTVDAGTARTAFTKVTLGGEVVLDALGGRDFGQRARVAIDSAVVSTGDTAGGGGGEPGWYVPPFFHGPSVPGALVLPISGDTRPIAGCLVVEAVAVDAVEQGTLHVATKRSTADQHVLDVDLVVVDGAGISEGELSQAVGVMADLYAGGGGPAIGDVGTWSVALDGGPFLRSSNAALAGLRSTRLDGANPWSMRFFFLADFQGDAGTLGISPGIPGAVGVPETAGSGVVLSVQGHQDDRGRLDVRTLGETMAHEAGHTLGLFHTTEAGGTSFDVLDDTPECDARTRDRDGDGEVSAEECADLDGKNFMFWVSGSFRQDRMSAGQADVLDRSPASVRAKEAK